RDDLYEETNLCLIIRTSLRLAEDEPERARRELAELMDRWSHEGFHVQHMNRLIDDTTIDLYEGDGARALGRLSDAWRELERSNLLRVQQIYIMLTHLRARAALATGRADLLREGRRDARALAKSGAEWGRALGLLIDAAVAWREGNKGRAAELL